MALEILGWSFQRPWALFGLLLAALIVLLSLERRRARSVPLGTARLFTQAGAPAASQRRRWLSASRVAAIAAILAGTLALASPLRPQERPEGEVLIALIDRTPSMFLAVDAGRAGGRGGRRRVDAAVAACREWALARERDRGVSVRIAWADVHAEDPYETATSSPDVWLTAPALRPPEAIWGAHDRHGVAWITDRLPGLRPSRAGVFASGGVEVPGLVAVDAGGGWLSTADGTEPLVRDPDVPVPRAVIGPTLPEELAALARIWAQERGLVASGAPDDRGADPSDQAASGGVLRLDGPPISDGRPTGAEDRIEVGRDGWSATVRAAGVLDRVSPRDPHGRVWLTDVPAPGAALRALVMARPGAVRVGFTDIDVAVDTGAEFAVSWSALFDATRRLPAGVVSLDERADAGAPGQAAPRPLDVTSGSSLLATVDGAIPGPIPGATAGVLARLAERDAAQAARRLTGALAAAAAALGLLAAGLRLRGSA